MLLVLNLIQWKCGTHENHLVSTPLMVLTSINLLEFLAENVFLAAAWSTTRSSVACRWWVKLVYDFGRVVIRLLQVVTEITNKAWFRGCSAGWILWCNSSLDPRIDQCTYFIALNAWDSKLWTWEVMALPRGHVLAQKYSTERML